jgi:hypothetical protein
LTGLQGWIPIAEKNLPYELTASFLLLPDRPGVPLPIKLQQQHRALFPLEVPITEASGVALANWASGAEPTPARSTEQEWLAKILAAKTTTELRAVGVRLKAAADTLKPEEIAALRAAFNARFVKVGGRKPKEVSR